MQRSENLKARLFPASKQLYILHTRKLAGERMSTSPHILIQFSRKGRIAEWQCHTLWPKRKERSPHTCTTATGSPYSPRAGERSPPKQLTNSKCHHLLEKVVIHHPDLDKDSKCHDLPSKAKDIGESVGSAPGAAGASNTASRLVTILHHYSPFFSFLFPYLPASLSPSLYPYFYFRSPL